MSCKYQDFNSRPWNMMGLLDMPGIQYQSYIGSPWNMIKVQNTSQTKHQKFISTPYLDMMELNDIPGIHDAGEKVLIIYFKSPLHLLIVFYFCFGKDVVTFTNFLKRLGIHGRWAPVTANAFLHWTEIYFNFYWKRCGWMFMN